VTVLVYAVVNSVGDVYEGSEIIAGARLVNGDFANCQQTLLQGHDAQKISAGNTTLIAIFTDAAFSKIELTRIAKMAVAGMGRAIAPVFTQYDGDLIFAISVGNKPAVELVIGAAAAEMTRIQMTSTHDVHENLAMAKTLIAEAAATGAGLVILPEMFAIMGLDQVDKVKHREASGQGPIQDFLREEALRQGVWLVGGTIPIAAENNIEKVRAACLVVDNKGNEVARYDKVHLFDARLQSGKEAYTESHTTQPGERVVVVPTPFGRLGLAVCYDVRFPELFRQMHAEKVEIIALPTAFTFTTGVAHWDILVRARAIENLVYVATACQVGTHPSGRRTYGHSMIVNPWGDVQASLPEGAGVISAEINLEYMRQVRQDFPALLHRRW
jgi:predicted amidohydrolase